MDLSPNGALPLHGTRRGLDGASCIRASPGTASALEESSRRRGPTLNPRNAPPSPADASYFGMKRACKKILRVVPSNPGFSPGCGGADAVSWPRRSDFPIHYKFTYKHNSILSPSFVKTCKSLQRPPHLPGSGRHRGALGSRSPQSTPGFRSGTVPAQGLMRSVSLSGTVTGK